MAEATATPTRIATPEEWRPVVGMEGYYEVSSHGRLRRLRQTGYRYDKPYAVPRDLAPCKANQGYLMAYISRPGVVARRRNVAILVAEAFIGPRPAGSHLAHLDGVRDNNVYPNLAYVSPRENMLHKAVHGTAQRGELNGFHSLTEAQVLEIRRRGALGESARSLGREYGVHGVTIGDVLNRVSWAHL